MEKITKDLMELNETILKMEVTGAEIISVQN